MNDERYDKVRYAPRPGTAWLEILKAHVTSMSYGVVQIVVHDGRVVQIERTEKIRFEKPENQRTPGE